MTLSPMTDAITAMHSRLRSLNESWAARCADLERRLASVTAEHGGWSSTQTLGVALARLGFYIQIITAARRQS